MLKNHESQPVSSVRWVNRFELNPNGYNPNKVAPREMELLVASILTCGWTQPIVIRENNEIVDGYHRWLASSDPRIAAHTGEMVPVVMLPKVSVPEQISATITHNRARGTHYIMAMADIIRTLKDDHEVSDKWLQVQLGMEEEEIVRLYDSSGSPESKGSESFGSGWVPDHSKPNKFTGKERPEFRRVGSWDGLVHDPRVEEAKPRIGGEPASIVLKEGWVFRNGKTAASGSVGTLCQELNSAEAR